MKKYGQWKNVIATSTFVAGCFFVLVSCDDMKAANEIPATSPPEDAKAMPQASAVPQIDRESDAQKRWRELAKNGKGVLVTKLKKDNCVRLALFPGANVMVSSSTVADHATMWFDTVDQLCDFLRKTGTGVIVGDGSLNLVDKEMLLVPFTDQEALSLRFGNPFQWGTQDDTAKAEARRVDFPLFDWVKRGTLFWLDQYQGGVFQYQSLDGKKTIVSGDPIIVQALVDAEIYDVKQMREFVQNRLPHVVLAFLGKREAYIVSRGYMDKRAAIPLDRWSAGGSSTAMKESEALLRKYVVDHSQVKIDDSIWSLMMYVTNRDGSIERWELVGRVTPFSIFSMKQDVVEKLGSVVPLPLRNRR